MVKEEGRDAAPTVVTATGPPLSSAPLTVLVDGDTASAAEILAGECFARQPSFRVRLHKAEPKMSRLLAWDYRFLLDSLSPQEMMSAAQV